MGILFNADALAMACNKAAIPAGRIQQAIIRGSNSPRKERTCHALGGIECSCFFVAYRFGYGNWHPPRGSVIPERPKHRFGATQSGLYRFTVAVSAPLPSKHLTDQSDLNRWYLNQSATGQFGNQGCHCPHFFNGFLAK
jgi:hypothetical protein